MKVNLIELFFKCGILCLVLIFVDMVTIYWLEYNEFNHQLEKVVLNIYQRNISVNHYKLRFLRTDANISPIDSS